MYNGRITKIEIDHLIQELNSYWVENNKDWSPDCKQTIIVICIVLILVLALIFILSGTKIGLVGAAFLIFGVTILILLGLTFSEWYKRKDKVKSCTKRSRVVQTFLDQYFNNVPGNSGRGVRFKAVDSGYGYLEMEVGKQGANNHFGNE